MNIYLNPYSRLEFNKFNLQTRYVKDNSKYIYTLILFLVL